MSHLYVKFGNVCRLQFTVIDIFGNAVNATEQCWNGHVLPQRSHLRGEEQRVKGAISDPEKVLEGNTPDAKEFWGRPDPGQGFQWGGVRVVAVVKYLGNGSGMLLTAYTTAGSIPQGRQLWP